MNETRLQIAEPFFGIVHLDEVPDYEVQGSAIILNLAESPIRILEQSLGYLQSVVVTDVRLQGIKRAVLIERFDAYADQDELFNEVKKHWPLAYDIRKEERLKGVSHYMSPKTSVRNINFSLYHSGSVPLNVGLHKEHPFCDVPGFREVHTQIVGYGKMQQCREQDINTLYLEEPMAPGMTHKPMFDTQGNYPWHQYETVTPSIFMAIEILPDGFTQS